MKVPDVISNDLEILFVGINPGLYSAKVGHHFARPGNRFWQALFLGGLTPEVLSPYKDRELLKYKLGITNFVDRESSRADELSSEEIKLGVKNLELKINKYKPKIVCFLGIGAYRLGFGEPKAKLGLQDKKIGDSKVWVLPNPSGLNAHFQVEDFGRLFKELKSDLF